MFLMNEHGASQVRLVAGPAQQMQETWVQCPGRGDPLAQEVATMPVFLPGKPYGQRSLADYSPWGCEASGTTEPPQMRVVSDL